MLNFLTTFFVKVKPRSAPLAAVEDLDKETENGYAIPRDNITPGSQVRYKVDRDQMCHTMPYATENELYRYLGTLLGVRKRICHPVRLDKNLRMIYVYGSASDPQLWIFHLLGGMCR
jgi:hypothetical protein